MGKGKKAIAAEAILSAELGLVITRIFDAPRQLVFKMWTEPEHLVLWWGPCGFTTISGRLDVRPSGARSRSMQASDGGVIRRHGVYRDIVAPERLVLTYITDGAAGNPGPETLPTVTFADLGDKARLAPDRVPVGPSAR